MPEVIPDPPFDGLSSTSAATREELISLLTYASDLEHSLACVCLFAASSLKYDVSEGGLTDTQADTVREWRQRLSQAALDRMRHLAQLANLLTAVGAEPAIACPTLLRPGPAADPQSKLTLEPFSPQLLDRLVAYERLNAPIAELPPAARNGEHPTVDSLTIGDLYDKIELCFGGRGAEDLLIGPKEAQATLFPLNPDDKLVTVVDLASVRSALAAIVGPGEAPGGAGGTSGSPLSAMRADYLTALEDARQTSQPFEPVRPVVANPVARFTAATAGGTRIVEPLTTAVADLFDAAYDTMLLLLRHFLTHTEETDADQQRLARASLRLMTAVVRPLGEALTRMPVDRASLPDTCAGPPFGDEGTIPEIAHRAALLALLDERLWQLAQAATKLRLTPGLPTEIQEATAALQELTCQFAPADGPHGVEARIETLKQIQAELGCFIQSALHGPYLATNVERMVNWLGEPIATRPQMALCRCGNSAIKPFCDGSHARIGFVAQKDPNRVPDQRDTYVGTTITVLDNRGLCQHSGFCTDRLNTVFHVNEERFVTPNGARVDDVIRAVRACPSGALSYALSGVEVRDGVDQTRPPSIEVSRDGAYRITGGIALKDWQGNDELRNKGASLEHYSLCRCGHSRNKPFCSGMHWYVDFHDPVVDEEHVPTLYEWAGGLPALLRMTQLFYGKYIPQDPLLRPLFVNMAPDHPERVASWLSEVFHGPEYYSKRYGGYERMLSQHIGKHITEEHRARWVNLLRQAADEAGVPNDAEFRSAFISYLEWGSHLAVENSTPGSHPPEHMPMPHWDWGTAGPPGSRVSALAPVQEEKPVALPSRDEAVHYTQHIKPLFRQMDRQSMIWAFDLWSYQDVKTHADAILQRLSKGAMPCDGAWPREKVETFQRWVQAGMQE